MPRNQDVPEWNNYRLSMSRMKSIQDVLTHWRPTCNFSTDGVDYRDYIRVSLKSLTLLEKPSGSEFCLLTEFANVRDTYVPAAQSSLVTARYFLSIWTATIVPVNAVVISVEEYLTKMTSVITIHRTRLFAVPPR